MTRNDGKGPARWGAFRFAVVGQLLVSPPRRGELQAALDELAAQLWEHPVTGEPTRFAASTIERWFYIARNATRDPVGALGTQPRKDAGEHPSIGSGLARTIAKQHQEHPSWSYQLHFDNLLVLARQDEAVGPVPSYPSVRRYMQAHGFVKQPRRRSKDPRREVRRGKGHYEVRSYEREYVNALWHLDFHEGSRALLLSTGEWKKPQLASILDDRSRLSCHGQWYWDEATDTLVHGTSQAIQKRGIPGEIMSDGGSAMKAAEFRTGLEDLGIGHAMTLAYSPYQNGKQEAFWGQVEGRFLPMLEGCRDLTLEFLNEAYQAWVELEYNQKLHSEIGMTPLERYLAGPDVGRPSPDSDALRRAFRLQTGRKQRRSDGTVSIQGRRFEVPSRYRSQRDITLRYARWDLGNVDMIDGRTGVVLCRLFPLDKAQNADGRRRVLEPLHRAGTGTGEPPASGMAPLLKALMAEYSATGLPPAYLPKPACTRDATRNDTERDSERSPLDVSHGATEKESSDE